MPLPPVDQGGGEVVAFPRSYIRGSACREDWQIMGSVVAFGYMVDEDNTMALPRGVRNEDYNVFVQAWAADGDSEITPIEVHWELNREDIVTWESVGGDATLISPYATIDCFDTDEYRALSEHGGEYLTEPAAEFVGCIRGACNPCGTDKCVGGIRWLCSKPITIIGVVNLEGDWEIYGTAIAQPQPLIAHATQRGRSIDWDPPETTFTVEGNRLYGTTELCHYDAQISPDRQSFSGTVWATGELDRYGDYLGTWFGHRQ